jgi:plasmid stability protein
MPENADLMRSLERVLRATAITHGEARDAAARARLRSVLAGEAAPLAASYSIGEAEILQDKTLGEIAFLLIALAPGRPGQQVFDHTARLREHAGNLLGILKRESRGPEAARQMPRQVTTLCLAKR